MAIAQIGVCTTLSSWTPDQVTGIYDLAHPTFFKDHISFFVFPVFYCFSLHFAEQVKRRPVTESVVSKRKFVFIQYNRNSFRYNLAVVELFGSEIPLRNQMVKIDFQASRAERQTPWQINRNVQSYLNPKKFDELNAVCIDSRPEAIVGGRVEYAARDERLPQNWR